MREALAEGNAAQQGQQGAELSARQELLLQALMSAAPEKQGSKAFGNNPYAVAADELSVIDAALAALCGGGEASAVMDQAGGGPALPALDIELDSLEHREQLCGEEEEDAAAAREGLQRCVVSGVGLCREAAILCREAPRRGLPLCTSLGYADLCRAQRESRLEAQQLRSIDMALRALKTGGGTVLVAAGC